MYWNYETQVYSLWNVLTLKLKYTIDGAGQQIVFPGQSALHMVCICFFYKSTLQLTFLVWLFEFYVIAWIFFIFFRII